MLGVLPSENGVMNVDDAILCKCDAPLTTIRKNVVRNNFVWSSGFSDPTDVDFKTQKGKWEEELSGRLSTNPTLANFEYGGITVLSMKPDKDSDTSIHLDTEIVFGVESNGTEIHDILDKISFGSDYYR